MAQTYRLVRQRHVRRVEPVKNAQAVDNVDATEQTTETTSSPSPTVILARIIEFIGGVVLAVLGIRFLLALLGANAANVFASFIYSVSHPFVAPFFGLFNYQEKLGVGRFEFETLIAMLFWGLVFWGLSRLVRVAQSSFND